MQPQFLFVLRFPSLLRGYSWPSIKRIWRNFWLIRWIFWEKGRKHHFYWKKLGRKFGLLQGASRKTSKGFIFWYKSRKKIRRRKMILTIRKSKLFYLFNLLIYLLFYFYLFINLFMISFFLSLKGPNRNEKWVNSNLGLRAEACQKSQNQATTNISNGSAIGNFFYLKFDFLPIFLFFNFSIISML